VVDVILVQTSRAVTNIAAKVYAKFNYKEYLVKRLFRGTGSRNLFNMISVSERKTSLLLKQNKKLPILAGNM
jgi:hypothetical protein